MYIFLQTESRHSGLIVDAIDMGRFATQGHTPFLIPSAIIKNHLELRVQSLHETKEDIWQLECRMGVRRDHPVATDPLTVDFDSTTKEINALNAGLAWTLHSCRRTEQILDFMDTMSLRHATQAALNNVSAAEVAEVQLSMQGSHAYLRSWNKGIEDRVEYLTKRLQALSQSVSSMLHFRRPETKAHQVYSGIAQRDSANSISIAETGTRLAATSHQVAIATSRDSAVMRVITAVTVVFLPATFTAVSLPRYTLTTFN